jgi:hypothetical protein
MQLLVIEDAEMLVFRSFDKTGHHLALMLPRSVNRVSPLDISLHLAHNIGQSLVVWISIMLDHPKTRKARFIGGGHDKSGPTRFVLFDSQ